MTTDDGPTAEKSLGDVVGDVSTKASLLVREEIELAKTEIAEKAKSLARGSAAAAAAGVMLVFGLIYFGGDSSVLLLPLLMIQLLWMTYAIYTFGAWLQKTARPARLRWVAAAAFTLLPLVMLLRIFGVM
jgi:hypothetical protein